jgi:hypothetical protein
MIVVTKSKTNDFKYKQKLQISQWFFHLILIKLFLNIKQFVFFIQIFERFGDNAYFLNTKLSNKSAEIFSSILSNFYFYLQSLISRFTHFLKLKSFKISKSLLFNNNKNLLEINQTSDFFFNAIQLNTSISSVFKLIHPFKFIKLILQQHYSLLSLKHFFFSQGFILYHIDKFLFYYFCVSFFKLYQFTAQLLDEDLLQYDLDVLFWRPAFSKLYHIELSISKKKKMQINFLLIYKYLEYLKKFNNDLRVNKLFLKKKNYSRDIILNQLNFIKRPTKVNRNSIYQKKFYKFISIVFFKKYLNILYVWFFNNSFNTSHKSQKIHRNIFIMYIKHLNVSFFSKYLLWINKSKRIVITLNVNIAKNNLFYTLMNSSGKTIATLSSGLYYALPRNKQTKRNSFKKSINYLSFEMFSLMFYNKFLFPLQYYKWDRQLYFFKGAPPINGDLEWRKINKKWFYNKKQKVYFIFKFSKYKHAFPGLSKKLIPILGRTSNNKLYEFVGLYKAYPRVHNGLSKKRPRRL